MAQASACGSPSAGKDWGEGVLYHDTHADPARPEALGHNNVGEWSSAVRLMRSKKWNANTECYQETKQHSSRSGAWVAYTFMLLEVTKIYTFSFIHDSGAV